jgi:hypothetical protein
MGAGLVDVGEFPLVVVRWPEITAGEVEADEVLRELGSFYGQRHAVLHDGVRTGGLNAAARRRMAQHSSQYEEEIRSWVVASAAIAPSAFTRGMIKAIQWVAPPPCPFRVFSEHEDAREWLLQALRRAGLWRPSPTP